MRRLLALMLATMALAACGGGPEPIRWGTDTCSLCRMVLTDRRFAAEFVHQGGRTDKFDGVDELARYLAQEDRQGTAYVGDGDSGNLVPAETATFLHAPALRAPMGGHLMSFAAAEAARSYAARQHLAQPRFLRYPEALKQQQQDDAHGGR